MRSLYNFPESLQESRMEAEEVTSKVSRLHSQLLRKLPEEKKPSLEASHLSFCHFSFSDLVYIMLSWTPSPPNLLEKEVLLQITVTNSLQGQKNFEEKQLLI